MTHRDLVERAAASAPGGAGRRGRMTWTWAEPFAGGAACALRLVGGERLKPPVAWMGGKRRLARAILDAMGVPEEPPSSVLLADAGPWGWVWPLLLDPSAAARVALVLRSWAGEHPRELWQRLAAVPPAEDLHERAAQWLWIQARSASGVPVWWEGWRTGGAAWRTGDGRNAHDRGEDMRWPGHQAQRAAWLASDGRGQPRPAGARAVGGRWEQGSSEARPHQRMGQRGRPEQLWRMGKSEGRETDQQGESRSRTGGMVNPSTIAARIEALAEAFARVEVQVRHGDARGQQQCDCIDCDGTWCVWCLDHHGRRPCPVDEERRAATPRVLLGKPTWVYLDPPYVGATGYGWDMPRAEVLELAQRWADAGAVVAVSEAEPLELPGWHHLELTREGGKPEWLTLSRPPARLPARQGVLFAPEGA